jgi:hypothetical protein
MSEGMHLLNVAGNKAEWPEHTPIGNLSSKIGQIPSMYSVLMVAILLILIKNRNISQKRQDV